MAKQNSKIVVEDDILGDKMQYDKIIKYKTGQDFLNTRLEKTETNGQNKTK